MITIITHFVVSKTFSKLKTSLFITTHSSGKREKKLLWSVSISAGCPKKKRKFLPTNSSLTVLSVWDPTVSINISIKLIYEKKKKSLTSPMSVYSLKFSNYSA